MSYQALTLAAGVAVEFNEVGDFFRLIDADASDVSLIFYERGKEIGRAQNIGEGYSERFQGGRFDRLRISSTAGGAIAYVTRIGGTVGYDKPPTGNVEVVNVSGAFVNAQETVTNASTTILAANAQRRYLLLQNNDAAGIIYVRLDGGVATTTTGIRIMPGGHLELQGYVPTGAITAIGSIASNANVISAEG